MDIFGLECVLRISLHRFEGIEFIPLHGYEGDKRSRLRNMVHFGRELPRAILQTRYGGDYNASYRDTWKHFIECIRGNTSLECTLDDGRRALQITLAAVESASTGKPVKVAQSVLPIKKQRF
jgi:predicted dehydrogenase